MSTIEVNKITPVSGGTTVQVGESGDTINIPAGATIANAGTATGFGVSLANGADNRVVTASSASALNGEANLRFDGSTVRVGSGTTSPDADGSDVVVEGSGNTGISILSGGTNSANLYLGTNGANNDGLIRYDNDGNNLKFYASATERLRIKQYDFCVGTTSPISTNGVTFKAGTTAGDDWISSYRTTASTPHYIHAFYSDAGGTQTAKYAVYADGTASAISDVNYKKNITNARNYLEDLEKIDVIKYNLKTDNEDEFKKLGFSAQQVETIFPNMIDADNTPLKEFYEEGDEIPEGKAIGDIKKTTAREVKLLKKEVFVPMLVKAVQELSAKVKTLETENTDIKARLTALESA